MASRNAAFVEISIFRLWCCAQFYPLTIARFIQSRFGELKISEARYEDLLSEADEHHPKYLNYLQNTLRMY